MTTPAEAVFEAIAATGEVVGPDRSTVTARAAALGPARGVAAHRPGPDPLLGVTVAVPGTGGVTLAWGDTAVTVSADVLPSGEAAVLSAHTDTGSTVFGRFPLPVGVDPGTHARAALAAHRAGAAATFAARSAPGWAVAPPPEPAAVPWDGATPPFGDLTPLANPSREPRG